MKLPPYPVFPTISDERVSLRAIVDEDIRDLVEISFYDALQATTLQEATVMQEKINADYLAGNTIHWGIADRLTNRLVGTCGYYRGFDKGEGELGCILLPLYRGKGFMTSAMKLAIEFGQNVIGLKRVRAVTSLQNKNAIKLLERLGFQKTGELEHDEVEYELISGNSKN